MLEGRTATEAVATEAAATEAVATEAVAVTEALRPALTPAEAVVLGYCAAVRGILNDDQGGPCIRPSCAWPRR